MSTKHDILPFSLVMQIADTNLMVTGNIVKFLDRFSPAIHSIEFSCEKYACDFVAGWLCLDNPALTELLDDEVKHALLDLPPVFGL